MVAAPSCFPSLLNISAMEGVHATCLDPMFVIAQHGCDDMSSPSRQDRPIHWLQPMMAQVSDGLQRFPVRHNDRAAAN